MHSGKQLDYYNWRCGDLAAYAKVSNKHLLRRRVASRHKQKTIINSSNPTEREKERDRDNKNVMCCLLLIFTTSKSTLTQDDRSGAYDRVTDTKPMALANNTQHKYWITFYFLHKTFLFWLSLGSPLSDCVCVGVYDLPVVRSIFLLLRKKLNKKNKIRPVGLFFLFIIHGSTFTRKRSGHLLEILKGIHNQKRAKNV